MCLSANSVFLPLGSPAYVWTSQQGTLAPVPRSTLVAMEERGGRGGTWRPPAGSSRREALRDTGPLLSGISLQKPSRVSNTTVPGRGLIK